MDRTKRGLLFPKAKNNSNTEFLLYTCGWSLGHNIRAQTRQDGKYRIQSSTLNNVPIANNIFSRTPTTWQDNNHSSKSF
jgi:hypothetical protein